MKSLGSCLGALKRMSIPARRWMLIRVLLGIIRIAASLSFVWICKEIVDVVTGASEAALTGRIALI